MITPKYNIGILPIIFVLFAGFLHSAEQKVYRVPIQGVIDLGLPAFVERVIEEAENDQVEVIIFDIDTFGGRVDAATQIKDMILDSKVSTVAFINKRAISAMKQSLKAFLPKINDIAPLSDFMTKCSNDEKYIGYLNKGKNNHLMQSATAKSDYCMLIGPEGDFSSSEINESQKFGFKPVSLGYNRLRTETAGLAACHILTLINEK